MQSKMSKSLLNRAVSGGVSRMMGARAFSNSVTYEMKDLIIDPDQKGKPVFSLYRLEESQMPTTATTNKDELITWMEDDVIPAGAESGLGIKDDSTQGITNMINKRYKVNEQVITNFENKFSAAINNLPKKKNDVYFFGHTAYCELSGKKPTNSGADWVKIGRNDFYKAGGPGSSCVIFSKAAIISIFEWVQAAKSLDLPIDMLFMELIKNRVITGWEVNTSITHNQMFYGLFEQLGTYCHHRKNNTIDI